MHLYFDITNINKLHAVILWHLHYTHCSIHLCATSIDQHIYTTSIDRHTYVMSINFDYMAFDSHMWSYSLCKNYICTHIPCLHWSITCIDIRHNCNTKIDWLIKQNFKLNITIEPRNYSAFAIRTLGSYLEGEVTVSRSNVLLLLLRERFGSLYQVDA